MTSDTIILQGIPTKVYSVNTVIVGTGAAGYNAAKQLWDMGQKDIAILTERADAGTSRNVSADKQAYYRISICGWEMDSPGKMAKNLSAGGSMDGDVALVEAAMSGQAFYNLTESGVPFPRNQYGEYIGYRSDYDSAKRGTSAGPVTSRLITERLEEEVWNRKIPILDGHQVIQLLTDPDGKAVIGLLALNLNQVREYHQRFVLFSCTNIIYATGGPGGLYRSAAYPASQLSSLGIALEAGAMGAGLTEFQYGICAADFPHMITGAYHQAIPRYISTNEDGYEEREFLNDYLEDPRLLVNTIFTKGTQWPFDAKKTRKGGTSILDLLLYNEIVVKGRRVFLDYTRNPSGAGVQLDFSLLDKEAYLFLQRSDALLELPYQRLSKLNQPAVELLLDQEINLRQDPIEITLAVAHHNGGLAVDTWWESNLRHLFPIGEAAGTHGIYVPGGASLNAGQVGGYRAAAYITANYTAPPMRADLFVQQVSDAVSGRIRMAETFVEKLQKRRWTHEKGNIRSQIRRIGERMDFAGGLLRRQDRIQQALQEARDELQNVTDMLIPMSMREMGLCYKVYDLLICQIAVLSAMEDYLKQGGKSRGACLVYDAQGGLPADNLPDLFRFGLSDATLQGQVQELRYQAENGQCQCTWRAAVPIPKDENWFETGWRDFRHGK